MDLNVIDAHLKQAIEIGWTHAAFRKKLVPIFQNRPWWKAVVAHEPYQDSMADFVFRDTIRAFHSAREWEQIQRTGRFAPFLRFVAIQDGRTCAMCNALHGKLFHVNNAIWPTLFPPNHPGCRCSIMQLSKQDLEEFGYKLDLDEAFAKVVIDPATGKPFAPAEGYDLHPLEANTIEAEITF